MNKQARSYHHGDLRNSLLDAAREILEKEGLGALSLRAVARHAGVSHAAPYRHFPSHDDLLAELAVEGFQELGAALRQAGNVSEPTDEKVARIGSIYMRFVAGRPALTRLMFGPQLPQREAFPALAAAAAAIASEIGVALEDPVLGIAVWAAVHGLAVLILEDVVDLGQRRAGLNVLPSRAEIVLRSLFTAAQN